MACCNKTSRLYRSRNGMIFGVCQGIADWWGVNAGYIRLALVILTIFTGFFPFGLLYLAAAFFLTVEPAYRERERKSHIRRGFYDLRQEFDDMASRFNKSTSSWTSRSTGSGTERDWDRRFNEDRD